MAYLLFAGEFYYPFGGAEDLIGKFDTLEEAMYAFNPKASNDKWANILDIDTLEIVKRFNRGWE